MEAVNFELPVVPEDALERSFSLLDPNVEVTALDIAPHGAFVVAGTSSGLVLLFDLTNSNDQKDGLLIGQIRARGMHTNLILSVKFSEDGRFVFAGVSKGSSEMLAIDLGRVLVNWSTHNGNLPCTVHDSVQQLQLKSLITFSFSDAKLRGFGAVARIGHVPHGTAQEFRVSARYRLACGKGIKNVHIWHFTAGYLAADDVLPAKERSLHGKWEYVCDVASNGNTITHIEFRAGGDELVSKSAGMCIRLWELNAAEVTSKHVPTPSLAGKSCDQKETQEADRVPAVAMQPVPPASIATNSGFSLRPSYTDIPNSQDIKCLLPVGTVAYGGTYQFAILNTGAPKEANRDVLELPERYSGDAAAAAQTAVGGQVGRGRRITREIEQVVCTEAGQHALVLCADGGVVFYGGVGRADRRPESDAAVAGVADKDHCEAIGVQGALFELPGLFRMKDQPQHLGSWALRSVGARGTPVLLRATADPSSGETLIEVCPLTALRGVADSTNWMAEHSVSYYVDSTFHAEQLEARIAWKRGTNAGAATAVGGVRSTKKVRRVEAGADEDGASAPPSATRKRKVIEKSPAGIADLEGLGVLATPGATVVPPSGRFSKDSPYEDATNRLVASAGTGSKVAAAASPTVPGGHYGVRNTSRNRLGTLSASSSAARLRAWREDDEEGRVEVDDRKSGGDESQACCATTAVKSYAPLHTGPAPKVRRLVPSEERLPVQQARLSSARVPVVEGLVRDWVQRCGSCAPLYLVEGGGAPLGPCGSHRLSVIAAEQSRLKDQFVRDFTSQLLNRASGGPCGNLVSSMATSYGQLAAAMVERQQLELQGACAADAIVSERVLPAHAFLAGCKVQFGYRDLIQSAAALDSEVSHALMDVV